MAHEEALSRLTSTLPLNPNRFRRYSGACGSAIRKALPEAEEVISYQMPAYKLGSGRILYFAGWKRHYSLYPAGAGLVEAFQDELARYEVSKSTIRFPLSEPVPVKLIGQHRQVPY